MKTWTIRPLNYKDDGLVHRAIGYDPSAGAFVIGCGRLTHSEYQEKNWTNDAVDCVACLGRIDP